MPQNFYELVWIFIIYAFIGWCTEVGYAAVDRGIFVNRGFLNGPYCPIYGCGMTIVIAVLTPLKDSLTILFIGSFLLTSLLEYVTGFLLEKVFHNKWWDYSDKPFNIKGYVCLKFSVYWGLACTFVMGIVHPMIYRFITAIPHTLGIVIVSVLMAVFLVDVVITVSTILKFNKRLKAMDEIAKKIHDISDGIGERVYENVTTIREKSEEFEENHAEFITRLEETKDSLEELPANTKEKLQNLSEREHSRIQKSKEEYEEKRREREELMKKYKELMTQKNFGFKRLMSAFPDMASKNQNEMLQKYKDHFNIKHR